MDEKKVLGASFSAFGFRVQGLGFRDMEPNKYHPETLNP